MWFNFQVSCSEVITVAWGVVVAEVGIVVVVVKLGSGTDGHVIIATSTTAPQRMNGFTSPKVLQEIRISTI
jgi:hypothetical protein